MDGIFMCVIVFSGNPTRFVLLWIVNYLPFVPVTPMKINGKLEVESEIGGLFPATANTSRKKKLL